MFNKIKNQKKIILEDISILILISFFIFIAYIKGTIALNYIILCLLIILLIIKYKHLSCPLCKYLGEYKKIFLSLSSFLIWIFFQALFISNDSLESLNEIRGQFLVPLTFGIVGAFLVLLTNKSIRSKIIFNIVFFTGFIHILIICINSINIYFLSGTLPIRKVYILPVDEVSFLTNLIYAMFLSEIYLRLITNRKMIFIKNWTIPFIFFCFLFSIYLQGMRWGVVTFSFTTLTFLFFCFLKIKLNLYKKVILFSSIIFLLIGLAFSSYKNDNRWSSFFETINIVLEDNSLYWVNPNKYNCPKLNNGQCVNLSNYLRPSQFINGLKLILDEPLGVGYSRYAYKTIVNKRYNNNLGVFDFPHSGMINLIIGVGIPGIILYLLIFYFILKKLIQLPSSYYKVFTIFLILAFHMRSFVDMTFMNHNLKVFMFLLGLGMVSALLYNKKEEINEKTKIN